MTAVSASISTPVFAVTAHGANVQLHAIVIADLRNLKINGNAVERQRMTKRD